MRNSGWILIFSMCLPASVVSTGQTQAHDLKITTRHTSGSSEFTSTIYYSGENSRSEMQFSSGDVKGHHRATIRFKGSNHIQGYELDLDSHEYISFQTDLRGGAPGAKPIAMKPSGKTYVINTDVVDTGERKEMFGHIARRLITKEKRIAGPENCYQGNTETDIDGWYIDYDALPLPMRPKAGVSEHLVVHSGGAGSAHCFDRIEAHRTGPQTGFPLNETITLTGETALPDNSGSSYKRVLQMEVVEFVESPLDPALFEVPPDFKKVKEIIDPTQRRVAQTYWERFKSELWSFFH
jgi:hypothetical protein